MRILHVINNLDSAGAERLVVDFAKAQCDAGHEASVLELSGRRTPLCEELESAGVALHTLGLGVYNPLCILRVRRYLRDADVVHVHLFPSQYWVAAARMLTRTKAVFVTTEHNTDNVRCHYWLTTQTDRWMYRRYDAATCISPAVEEFMRERTRGRLPLVLIENGISLQRFRTARAEGVREALGLSADVFLLIQVARFRRQKNQDCVLRALTHLPDDVHALFVGDGPRLDECRELAERLGVFERAHFLGARTDVPALIQASDLVVMSSHWEGFGLAAVEGMAAGKPALASRVEGLSQVVGNEDLLFNPDDDLQLSKKVVSLRADSETYARAAEYCRARAGLYDIANTSRRLIKFYEDTINRTQKR